MNKVIIDETPLGCVSDIKHIRVKDKNNEAGCDVIFLNEYRNIVGLIQSYIKDGSYHKVLVYDENGKLMKVGYYYGKLTVIGD